MTLLQEFLDVPRSRGALVLRSRFGFLARARRTGAGHGRDRDAPRPHGAVPRCTRSCSPRTCAGTCRRCTTTPRTRASSRDSSTTSTSSSRCTATAGCAAPTIGGRPRSLGGANRDARVRPRHAVLHAALPHYRFLDDHRPHAAPSCAACTPPIPVNRHARGGVQIELPPRIRAPGRCAGARRRPRVVRVSRSATAAGVRRRCSGGGRCAPGSRRSR